MGEQPPTRPADVQTGRMSDRLAQRIQAAMIADCLARPYPCPCCTALNATEET